MSAQEDSARVRFPPPFVYALGFIIGLGLQRLVPAYLVPNAWRWPIAALFFAGWLTVSIPALATFARTHTPLNPNKPVHELFTSGIYRITRNPLYVGLALLYLGGVFEINSVWLLVMLAPVLLFIDIAVVRKEELYLTRKFGEHYTAYKQRVRRWS